MFHLLTIHIDLKYLEQKLIWHSNQEENYQREILNFKHREEKYQKTIVDLETDGTRLLEENARFKLEMRKIIHERALGQLALTDGSHTDPKTAQALAAAENALMTLAEQRLETTLETEEQQSPIKVEEQQDVQQYFSTFAAKQFTTVVEQHEEQIEIMQEAITTAMDQNTILQNETQLTNFKYSQMESLFNNKEKEMSSLDDIINQLDKKLNAERQMYKDTLWRYLQDIAKVRSGGDKRTYNPAIRKLSSLVVNLKSCPG